MSSVAPLQTCVDRAKLLIVVEPCPMAPGGFEATGRIAQPGRVN